MVDGEQASGPEPIARAEHEAPPYVVLSLGELALRPKSVRTTIALRRALNELRFLSERTAYQVLVAESPAAQAHLARALNHYETVSLERAFCAAVDAGHIPITPASERIDTTWFTPTMDAALDDLAAGVHSSEIDDITPQDWQTLVTELCVKRQRAQNTLGILRSAYEVGLRATLHASARPTMAVRVDLPADAVNIALTGTERRVLECRSRHPTHESAAAELGLSESTLKSHLNKVRAKLGEGQVATLVTKAIALGLIGIASDPGPDLQFTPLTHKELEVMAQIAAGKEDAAIAEELGIVYETVRTHVSRAMLKIGVHSRVHAVRRVFELRLLAATVPAARK